MADAVEKGAKAQTFPGISAPNALGGVYFYPDMLIIFRTEAWPKTGFSENPARVGLQKRLRPAFLKRFTAADVVYAPVSLWTIISETTRVGPVRRPRRFPGCTPGALGGRRVTSKPVFQEHTRFFNSLVFRRGADHRLPFRRIASRALDDGPVVGFRTADVKTSSLGLLPSAPGTCSRKFEGF
jgi:hypothetical protein